VLWDRPLWAELFYYKPLWDQPLWLELRWNQTGIFISPPARSGKQGPIEEGPVLGSISRDWFWSLWEGPSLGGSEVI
jgi:hypothetical protein